MHLTVVSCLLFVSISVMNGQEFRTKAITTANGLTQGYINTIFQDSRGYVWIGTPSGLNRYDGYDIKTFSEDENLSSTLGTTAIFSITETTDGLLWLGTSRGLVVFNPVIDKVVPVYDYLEDIARGTFELLEADDQGKIWLLDMIATDKQLIVIRPAADLKKKITAGRVSAADFRVQTIAYDTRISQPIQRFMITRNNTIFAIDSKDQICQINTVQCKAEKADINAFEIKREGYFGTISLKNGRNGVIFRVNSDTMSMLSVQDYRKFVTTKDGSRYSVRFSEQGLYSLAGLHRVQYDKPQIDFSFYNSLKTVKQADAGLTAALVDTLGNIWLGTIGYGVRILYKEQSLFEHFFKGFSMTEMIPVAENKIWPGLFAPEKVFQIGTDSFETAPWVKTFPDIIQVYNYFVSSYGDEWLLGTGSSFDYTLFHKKKGDQSWQRSPVKLAHVGEDPVLMYEHTDRTVWIFGNLGEIFRYHPANQQYEQWNVRNRFASWQQNRIRSLSVAAEHHDVIWLGVIGGLIKIEKAITSPTFQVYHNYDKQRNRSLFSNEEIISLYVDKYHNNYLWLGTRGGGLIRFDKNSLTTTTYNTRHGLLNNVVYSILPDEQHRFWISTNKGISIFYPKLEKFINPFSPVSDISTEFNTSAHMKLPDGRMAFGSVNGLFVVTPKAVKFSFPVTTVSLSGIKINGTPLLSYQDQRLTLSNDLAYRLSLPHDQNNISLNFAALPVTTTKDIIYRYRIPKLQDGWVELGSEHTLNLTALPYGKYTLELQSSMIIGNWNKAPITKIYLHIIRPWYLSLPAWIAYSLITFIVAFLIITYYRNKIMADRELRANQLEAERLKSLDEFKNRFFSYVAHEFKTPLTVILGMSQRLKQYPVPDNISETLNYQAANLNELVNQLIDIGKSERKTIQLDIKQINISNYIRYLVESLRQLAEPGGISLNFDSTIPDLITDIDPVRLKYVIHNLLTNAFRHTPEGGKVSVKLGKANEHQLLLTIADNGEGISESELPFIFQRHFQGQSAFDRSNTFGLGLPFVKDLIFLFNGDIDVQSKSGMGTTFTITLPITHTSTQIAQIPNSPVTQAFFQSGMPNLQDELPIILIVEDNPSISSFLKEALNPHFNVIQASNGRRGYELAVQHLPDIILTDLIMPLMDGFELTEQIKTNMLTSHIPVVMVSAQSALEQRLSGHHVGVDAFISKPFHEQELVLILLNMITLQQRWKERYAVQHAAEQPKTTNTVFFSEYEQTALISNDQFMDQLYKVFETHYSHEDFDRDFLCHELHISKSQLHRKLSAISSLPAMELLRKFRLEKAYAIIEVKPELQIREICFMIGMKHPAHFTSLFTQQFGISPSELKKITQLKKMQ